ncbi:hypothetical protein MBOT_08240 [Mycobacterium botniense]|uniref:DUF3263 domain-containing protein n=2 Tax=Mycobacterium botniense TaxID=84962 RepID=A0A7I9XTX2_9MYCO|nr:hypothetical protein MBOT_08240 [Mycobacterium botniense]
MRAAQRRGEEARGGVVRADDARRAAAGGQRLAGVDYDSTVEAVVEYSPKLEPYYDNSPEGSRRSDMDSAMARANQSGDDSEIADGLTRREHEILAFERQWWKYAGAKEEAIKELFSMSATRYYQVLNALVDRPEALAADPMLVKRLRRLRASRQKARAARRLGFEVT